MARNRRCRRDPGRSGPRWEVAELVIAATRWGGWIGAGIQMAHPLDPPRGHHIRAVVMPQMLSQGPGTERPADLGDLPML